MRNLFNEIHLGLNKKSYNNDMEKEENFYQDNEADLNRDFDNELDLKEQEKSQERHQHPINLNMKEDKYSIFDICNQIDDKLIELNPNFQRGNSWNEKQKSELIESILIGIPVPPIYVYQNNNGNFDVVDGKQRLSCVNDFYKNKFKLKGLTNLDSLNDKNFKELERKDQAQIKRYQFYFYAILPNTDERIKYDIFDRVNRGGVRLNNQEMRNALYHGKATDLIDELSEIQSFKKAANITDSMHQRMRDRYLILRFVAFYLFINNYTPQIKTINGIDNFLKDIMEYINSSKIKFDFGPLKVNFKKTMDFIAEKYGNKLFRFNPKQENKTRKLNIPLFESSTFAFVSALEQGLDFPNKESIDKFKKILDEPKYITFGIDSNDNVKFRFDLAKKLIKGELNA